MPPKFTDTDLDRLEAYLGHDERADSTLPLDAIQGMFAAIACAGKPVPREAWLAEILGEGHMLAPDEQRDEIVSLLERFSEDTARQLNEGEGFDFILYGPEDEEDLAVWAEGFLVGVDLADPPWDDESDPEDLDNMLFPFLALTGQEKGEGDQEKMLAEIREGLPNHLLDIREYWFAKAIPPTVKRDGPKVGRNDPCPCGSGKKYKSCHGA